MHEMIKRLRKNEKKKLNEIMEKIGPILFVKSNQMERFLLILPLLNYT